MKIAIVDYGMGNIHSLSSALEFIGATDIVLTRDENAFLCADKIILPGVGNFSMASQLIYKYRLDEILYEAVIEKQKPILGVCLGMQLLGLSSTENGVNKGLGFVEGHCEKFDCLPLKIPHVGYNQVNFDSNSRLYAGLDNNSDFYFTHSYKMLAEQDIGQSLCHYGDNFVASFEKNNIAGAQFHPELSQKNGLKLLQNFIEHF